jgi:hypothetical protein
MKLGKGSYTMVHRFAYEQLVGPIPEGTHHKCENPWCTNPKHLKAVTRKEHIHIHGTSKGARWALRSSLGLRTHCRIASTVMH